MIWKKKKKRKAEVGGGQPKQLGRPNLKNKRIAGHLWLTPAILVTQGAEIRRIEFKASLAKQFCKPLF
jgi:hypothetical protein